jgi:hypothetical protein
LEETRNLELNILLLESANHALFVWLISHQPAILLSQNKPDTNNQPTVVFSQNKPASATNHQPNEHAARRA